MYTSREPTDKRRSPTSTSPLLMNPEEEVDVAEDVEAVAATVMEVVVMIAMEVGVMDLAVEDLVEMPVDLVEAEAPVEERKSST